MPIHHTCFEYDVIPYEELGISSSNEFIDDLEALNRAHGLELVRVKRHALQATQYVGLIRTSHGTLEILPKVDRQLADKQRAARNLIAMLCYANDIPLVAESDASLSVGLGNWFEILTGLFVRRLYDQLQQGIDQDYVTVEDRHSALRGRWLIQQQLTRQAHIRHSFELRYDEFLPNTPLNKVFRYATELLIRISRTPSNQRLLTSVRSLLTTVDLLHRVDLEDLNRITFTRLNERFYPPFQLARLLIESMTQVVQTGNTPLTAFVFNMNLLFEKYVAGFLNKHWREIVGNRYKDYSLKAQMQSQRQLYLAHNSQGLPAFRLVPDVLIQNNLGQASVIIDTKYKSLDPSVETADISESDVYQMLAYAGRLNCDRVLLLYPSNRGHVKVDQFAVVNSTVRIDVQTINIHQRLDDITALMKDFRAILAMYIS